jgi:hypothetical protein
MNIFSRGPREPQKLYRRKRDGQRYWVRIGETTFHAQWGLSVYLIPYCDGRSHWKSVERFNAEFEAV